MAVGGAGNTTGTSKRKPFSIIFVGPLVLKRNPRFFTNQFSISLQICIASSNRYSSFSSSASLYQATTRPSMAPSAPASSWRKNLAKCFVLWVGICHGGWAVVGRDVTKNSSDFRPLFVATARNFGGFCLLFLIALIRDRGIVWPQQKDLSRIVAAGVCDAFIGQVRRRDATRLLPSCGVK